jgi:hypothetical protein
MTDIWQQPPADRPVQYVKFGPAPHQEIRAEVASVILTAWRGKSPKQFGEALAAAMLDTNGHTP